jgi:3-isopropylmalate/(R)-2-methylmalate dehydratase small subunit
MIPLVSITGRAAVLALDNISTDVIIPTRHSLHPDKSTMGAHAFEALRSGSSDFPYDQPGLERAPILLAGHNFACGSSREPAVWALLSLGVRVVIAPSFGDIFSQNAGKNGLLALPLPQPEWMTVRDAAEHGPITVDLDTCTISWEGGSIPFTVPERRRHALLNGLDEIDATMALADLINGFQRRDRDERPWVYALPQSPLPLDPRIVADPRSQG